MSSAPELEALEDFEMLPPIAEFFALLDRIAAENMRALEHIGGNILIHVRGAATRTIITRGPHRGVHHEARDEKVEFALVCEEWVLLELLDDSQPVDLAPMIDGGYLHIQGDFKVWDRYLDLGQQKSTLAIRAGIAETQKSEKKPAKRLRSTPL